MAQRQWRDWRLAEAVTSRHEYPFLCLGYRLFRRSRSIPVGHESAEDNSFSIMAHFWQNSPARERRSCCLSPFLGGPLEPVLASSFRLTLVYSDSSSPKLSTKEELTLQHQLPAICRAVDEFV